MQQGDDHQGDLNDQEDGDDDGGHHGHPVRVSPLGLLDDPILRNLFSLLKLNNLIFSLQNLQLCGKNIYETLRKREDSFIHLYKCHFFNLSKLRKITISNNPVEKRMRVSRNIDVLE